MSKVAEHETNSKAYLGKEVRNERSNARSYSSQEKKFTLNAGKQQRAIAGNYKPGLGPVLQPAVSKATLGRPHPVLGEPRP